MTSSYHRRGRDKDRDSSSFLDSRRRERERLESEFVRGCWACSPSPPPGMRTDGSSVTDNLVSMGYTRDKNKNSSNGDGAGKRKMSKGSRSDGSRRRSSRKQRRGSDDDEDPSESESRTRKSKSGRRRRKRSISSGDDSFVGGSDGEYSGHGIRSKRMSTISSDETENNKANNTNKDDNNKRDQTSSRHESEDEWVEKEASTKSSKKSIKKTRDEGAGSDTDDEDIVGPTMLGAGGFKVDIGTSHKAKLMPGEADAMSKFIEEGTRIPRRGEIGLETYEIENYETDGYVMSGSRHRRMEAVRMRKENQMYTADERRELAMHNYEVKQKKERELLTDFREKLSKKGL